MAGSDKQLMYHVHQYLREKNLLQTLRSLETESRIYLDLSHVEVLIQNGEWDQLHKYITGFFSYGDDRTTMEISFQIKKQKFFEALKKNDHPRAHAILFEEGNTFREYYQDKLIELLLLLFSPEDPWNDNMSAGYQDQVTSRAKLFEWIKDTFQNHAGLREKVQFPNINKDLVLSVVSKQSLNCPKIKSSDVGGSSSGIFSKHQHGSVEASHSLGSELLSAPPRGVVPIEELPKANVPAFESVPGMVVTCFEFSPKQDDILVVGTGRGVVFSKKMGSPLNYSIIKFKVLKPVCFYSKEFQSVLSNGEANAVTCVRWTPDGRYLGVGFSKHLFQVWLFKVGVRFEPQMEIEAHSGSVNDSAFYTRNQQLFIVTCGSDRLVKIWNQTTLTKPLITLERHATPVKSVSFFEKEQTGFVCSTDNDGKMKLWEVADAPPPKEYDFDVDGFRFDKVLTKWGDTSSVFTSEADRDSLPSITEWGVDDDSMGLTCKRRYTGLEKIPDCRLSFDNNGKILVAGYHHSLKFWDVNFEECLWTTTLSYELQGEPIVRLSKSGRFLAVLDSDKGVRIFGNLAGLKSAFANGSAFAQPQMLPSINAEYVLSARALGVDNLRETAQPRMPTFSGVPSLSVGRASNAELRGHPRMLTSEAVPKLLNADSSPATTRMLNASAAPSVSTDGASNPGLLASHVASSSSAHRDKHKLT